MKRALLPALSCVALAGCTDWDSLRCDGGVVNCGQRDAGPAVSGDAGADVDAGGADAAVVDAGSADAGGADAAVADSGSADAAVDAGGGVDAGGSADAAVSTVTVSFNIIGSGSIVETGGGGFTCATAACVHDYPLGANVSFTAVPGTGVAFAGWTVGGCNGNNPVCMLTLSTSKTVTATFGPPLTVSVFTVGTASGAVTSSPTGITCGSACTSGFVANTVVTLTAAPATGSWLGGWSGACVGIAPRSPCVVTMDQARSVGAKFVPESNYAFFANVVFDGGGVATVDALCNQAAIGAGLPGNYIALLPSATQDVSARLSAARGWARPDGRPFLDTFADGLATPNAKILYPPVLLADGGHPLAVSIATGLTNTGAASNNTCRFWTSSDAGDSAAIGDPASMQGSEWIAVPITVAACTTARVYCFGIDHSTPLVVAQPSPVRRAFASNGSFSPGAGGVGGADTLCQNEATDAGLPGTYKALLALTSTSAGGRFDAGGPPFARVDGVLLAPTAAEFLTADVTYRPLATATTDSHGAISSPGYSMWAGASSIVERPDSGVSNCGDWTNSGAVTGLIGFTNRAAGGFFQSSSFACNQPGIRVLCLQE